MNGFRCAVCGKTSFFATKTEKRVTKEEIMKIETNDTWKEMEKLVDSTLIRYKSDFFNIDYDEVYDMKDGTEFFFAVRDYGTHIIKIGHTPDMLERRAQLMNSVIKTFGVKDWYLVKKNVSIEKIGYKEAVEYMNRKLDKAVSDSMKRTKEFNHDVCSKGEYITYKDSGLETGGYGTKILDEVVIKEEA